MEALISDQESCVFDGDRFFLTNFLKLVRGTQQSDPISVYLLTLFNNFTFLDIYLLFTNLNTIPKIIYFS